MSNETADYLTMPAPPTDEEWAKIQPLIDQAIADGNPWAAGAGISRKDAAFEEWIEITCENRRKADAEPNC